MCSNVIYSDSERRRMYMLKAKRIYELMTKTQSFKKD